MYQGSWGPRTVQISKTLASILRHKACELGVSIRPDGFCSLQEVLDCSWILELGASRHEILACAKSNDKKRFETRDIDGVLHIRACQGHSMKVVQDEQLLRKLHASDADLPGCCVHGTYMRHFASIIDKGLIAGGSSGSNFRNHVHFAPFAPGDKRVISGMRASCEIAIWVNIREALEEGLPFFMSNNQVILSPGGDGVVGTHLFEAVRDVRSGACLWDPYMANGTAGSGSGSQEVLATKRPAFPTAKEDAKRLKVFS